MSMPRRFRLRQMTRATLWTLGGWLLLVLIAWWQGARWPQHGHGWHTFLITAATVEFWTLKAWVILSRMHGRDWLALALAAADGMMGFVLFWYFVVLLLWPGMRVGPWESQVSARLLDLLFLAVAWAFVEMVLIPDPPDDGGAPP